MSLLCHVFSLLYRSSFFFFNDTATTEIYTLSLHDALPISLPKVLRLTLERCDRPRRSRCCCWLQGAGSREDPAVSRDRKSTRLNSSHGYISYAVFCLKKKKTGSKPSADAAMAEESSHINDT